MQCRIKVRNLIMLSMNRQDTIIVKTSKHIIEQIYPFSLLKFNVYAGLGGVVVTYPMDARRVRC